MYIHNDFRKRSPILSRIKQRKFCFSVMLLVYGLLYSCASQPKEEPVVQEESADDTQLLRDMEEKAKGAIARAESAGAAKLSPLLLNEAYRNLLNGQEKDPQTDGGAQREQYLAAIEKANQAYDDAVYKSRDYWLVTVNKYKDDLEKFNARLYLPEYNARSQELLQQLRNTIYEGDNDESLALYQSIIPNVDAVVTALVANLDWLDQLRQEVAGLLGEASRQDLYGEAATMERLGRDAYNSAMEHHIRGDMQSIEQDLYDARYYLHEAMRLSGALDSSSIDAMLRRVQKQLEDASKRDVVDEDGNMIEIEPWNGEAYLRSNPLMDLSKQGQSSSRRRDESQLQWPQVSEDFLPPLPEDNRLSELLPIELPQEMYFQVAPGSGRTLSSANWEIRAITQQISRVPGDTPSSSEKPSNSNRQNSREGNPFGNEKAKRPKPQATSSQVQSLLEVEDGAATEPTDREYFVAEDIQAETSDFLSDAQLLLRQAANRWENGVRARNNGNLPRAQHYFEETERLVDQYNVQYAILGHYTVRTLKPEDCLWRIAGYSDIYGDPFQWTRIYQRNRDIISNPSLIYPGQRLVIPPAK